MKFYLKNVFLRDTSSLVIGFSRIEDSNKMTEDTVKFRNMTLEFKANESLKIIVKLKAM